MSVLIAKNITTGPAYDVYVDDLDYTLIPASSQTTMTNYFFEAQVHESTDLRALINDDKVVLILDGIEFTKAQSLAFMDGSDIVPTDYYNAMKYANSPSQTNPFITLDDTGGLGGKKRYFITAHADSVVADKWIGIGHGISSDLTPLIVAYTSSVIGMTWSNEANNSNIDVLFYKNGITANELIYTWQIRSKRYAYQFNDNGYMSFNYGDRLSIYCQKVTTPNPSNVDLHIFFEINSESSGSGGSGTL